MDTETSDPGKPSKQIKREKMIQEMIQLLDKTP
jgi:hypothetical protein